MKKLLAAILLIMGAGAAFFLVETVHAYRGYRGSVMVIIPPGSGAAAAARTLTAQGVLQSRIPFLALYAIGRLQHKTLKAGEYLFDHPLGPRDVYGKIVRGEVYYHLVVIPEGSDRFDIARIFHDKLGLDAQEFLQATARPDAIRDLDPNAPSLEGYLFPDSYRFPASTTVGSAVTVLVARFRQVLDSRIRPALSADSNANLHDVLTLASLVEKETPNPEERPRIAGVFTRRLERHMPLDCDPTVAYAARLAAMHDGPLPAGPAPITSDQLAANSPYNTYRRAGLPPGPICSPSTASVEAALHPAAGDALYFVSNLQGGHVFANTLDEHNRNVARYRREQAGQQGMDIVPAPAPAARVPKHQTGRRKKHTRRGRN